MKTTYRFKDNFFFHFDNITYWHVIEYYLGLITGYILGWSFVWWGCLEMGGLTTFSEKWDFTYQTFKFIYDFFSLFFTP